MSAARAVARTMMVRFCRLRKASAPSLMASEIACISFVPVSLARTHLASQPATARETTEIPIIRGTSWDCIGVGTSPSQ